MVSLMALWLPILLAAVLVFIASSILHMVLPFHRSDYQQLPGEERLLESMRKEGVGRGNYTFPWCKGPKDLESPEVAKKFEQGPVGLMNVHAAGLPSMGRFLAQWFVFCIVVGVFVGYLTSRALAGETDPEYLRVFQISSTAAFMAYGLGQVVDSIWKAQFWSTTFKHLLDALIYALLTAGCFAWLWPN